MTVVAGSLTIPAEATPRTSGEEFFRTEGAYTGLDEPIPGGQIARWLLVEGPHIDSGVELFDELCWRLLGDDVPLWRAAYHVGVLHPQIRGIGLRWLRDRKVVEDYRILHGSEETDEYRLSPIRATIERGIPFRRRLDRPVPEYPLLDRIRKAGGTDYFALALNRTFRRFPTVTWATDRPDGFRDADIAKLEDINPALAAIAETRAERRIGTSLLDTYLGPQAGRRILAGQILRAQGERMRAVIMMTDMRDFTGLSDRLPGDAVIELLDDYFDAIVSPIQENKGEILKFMGDGVLAIFLTEDDEDFAPSSLRALAAATQGLERLAAINKARRETERTEACSNCGSTGNWPLSRRHRFACLATCPTSTTSGFLGAAATGLRRFWRGPPISDLSVSTSRFLRKLPSPSNAPSARPVKRFTACSIVAPRPHRYQGQYDPRALFAALKVFVSG